MAIELTKIRKKILIALGIFLLVILALVITIVINLPQKQSQTGESSLPKPEASFEVNNYTYFSSFSDPNFYYRFSRTNKTLERISRSSQKVSGKTLQFSSIETVQSNDAYSATLVKGAKNEEQSTINICNFETGTCSPSPKELVDLALAPEGEFALASVFNLYQPHLALIDLKDFSEKELAKINSAEYDLGYIDRERAVIIPRATAPGDNAISLVSLISGEIREIINRASYFALSPKRDYLVYSKYGANSIREVYLYNLANGNQNKLDTKNIHAVFFNRNGDQLILAKEETNKVTILSFNLNNLNETSKKINEFNFSDQDMITDVIWLQENNFLLLTKSGYQREISL